jgi:hypothetical protein
MQNFPPPARRWRDIIPAFEGDPVRVDEFRFREPGVPASFQPFSAGESRVRSTIVYKRIIFRVSRRCSY